MSDLAVQVFLFFQNNCKEFMIFLMFIINFSYGVRFIKKQDPYLPHQYLTDSLTICVTEGGFEYVLVNVPKGEYELENDPIVWGVLCSLPKKKKLSFPIKQKATV